MEEPIMREKCIKLDLSGTVCEVNTKGSYPAQQLKFLVVL